MNVSKKIILKKLTFFLLLTICLLTYLTLNFSQTANAQTTINGSTIGGQAAVNYFYTNDTTFPLTNPPGTSSASDIYNNLSYYYQNYYDTGSCNYSSRTHNDEAVELGWLSQAGVPTLNLEGSTDHIPYTVQYIPGTNFNFVFDLASVFCYYDVVGGIKFPNSSTVTSTSSPSLHNIAYMAYNIDSATVSGGGTVTVPPQTTTKLNFYTTQHPNTIQHSIWYSHSANMIYTNKLYASQVNVTILITPYLKYVNPVRGNSYQCISGGGHTFSSLTALDRSCFTSGTFTIHFLPIFKPYFQVKAGDVVAGSTRQLQGCSKSANISGYSADTTSSGSEYAAIATGTISNFVSGQGLYSSLTNPLTFANFNNFGTNSSNYGGNFGTAPCLTNYFHPPSSSRGSNTYTITSTGPSYYSIPTNATKIKPGQHYTYYVNGNVTISHNIVFQTSSITNPAQIPSFNLIVNGNIYIDSSVTQLDGLYQALGTGINGNIYDCNTGTGSSVIVTPVYPECSHQLTVNGSMMAQNTFHLDRTTIPPYPQPNGPPAEIFNLSPLMWFDQVTNNSSGTPAFNENNNQLQYASLTSLPPIY